MKFSTQARIMMTEPHRVHSIQLRVSWPPRCLNHYPRGSVPNLNYDFGLATKFVHKKPHRAESNQQCGFLTLLVASGGVARFALEASVEN
jgi:hypothetical protein